MKKLLLIPFILTAGCGSMTQRDHETTTSVWAIGVPGIAVIKQSTISPDNKGNAHNEAKQVNPITVSTSLKN